MTTVNVSSISGRTVQVSYTGAYAGETYPSVTMVDPITDDPASVAYQTTHPVVAGDVFEWDDVNSLNVSVDSSGLITADSEGSFQGRWFDVGDQVYGDWETYTFEVVATVVPQGTITVTVTESQTSASVAFSYDGDDADSFEHSIDGTNWIAVTSPFDRLGLTAGTPYSDGQIRAVNEAGSGAAQSYSFTTLEAPDTTPPVLTINNLTTHIAAPIVTGTCDDAVSLTLVVDGVTYNPTPSGGFWSQTLTALPVGQYTMTLNGQDSEANSAIEVQGSLEITANAGLKRRKGKVFATTSKMRIGL